VAALNADAADYALHNHNTLPGIRIRAIPSPAYRLALAAAGEVDAGISLVWGLEPWDIAGGHALLTGAGRVLVDRHGRPVDYRRGAIVGCIGGLEEVVARIVASDLAPGKREKRKPARPRNPVRGGERLSRAHGCLLGQLAGDALGSAVEFKDASSISAIYPNGVRDLIDGGTWSLIAGQPTDDSELALALARQLALKGEFDLDAIKSAYIEWLASGPFDVGTTTRNAIEALKMGWRVRAESQSNGALMRVSPIGIFANSDAGLAARLAARDAQLTHPHPVCVAASAAYAAAIAAGIGGATTQGMWDAAHSHAGTDEAAKIIRERLKAARTAPPEEFQDQMGWVLTAFQNGFFWLLNGATLEDALVATVGSGGDTDTNGAVCGALLGAAQGRNALPPRWRNAILSCKPVRADDIVHPRPTTYWPDDALELAEALLAARDNKD
jgi:ADP-ribosylglycohydrolase